MKNTTELNKSTPANDYHFFRNGGEMGELTRRFDWSKTELGTPDTWTQSLQMTLAMILTSKFPMFLWWGDNLIQFYNDAYRPSLGNNGKHPKALGQQGADCWQEIWDSIKPIIDRVLNGGESHFSEDQLLPIYRNGKIEDVYWTFSYSPINDGTGKVRGVLVTCVETTDKMVNLHKLKNREEELEFAIEAAEMATFDYSPNTNKFKANKRLKDWFGLKPDSEIDLSIAISSIKESDQKRVTAAVQDSLKYALGGKYDIVYTIIHPVTKEERIVRAKGTCSFDEHQTAIRLNGTLLDITKAQTSRKKIEEAKEKADLAVKAGELGVFELILSNNHIITNDRFNEIYGFKEPLTREQYVATCHPDDIQKREKHLEDAMTTGSFSYELRFIHQKGTKGWIKVKGTVAFDENGKPHKLIGVIQDITEQKAYSESMARQVLERTIELQRSNQDLLQFAHVTSHDLKEPIRKIRTFSNRFQDEFGADIPEKGKIYLEKINQASSRMFSMIDGVLAYSTLNASENPIEKIDLNEVIKEIQSDLEVAIQRHKATFLIKKLPVVEGAYILMYQLFYNLIGNSLKFSRENTSVEINVSASLVKKENVDFSEIIISDNGIGFDNQFCEKIFGTFSRLHSKDLYEGTGLGLALCRRIVERHHGYIHANGEINKGAAFTILLPLKQTNKFI